MRTRLLDLWDQLRGSLWFVPGWMSLAALLLAVGVVEFESRLDPSWMYQFRWLSTGTPAGARAILSTIAGSMITVAGVTFSITIVALSLASSQFGPRLLRNFMRDRINQIVLGMFIATFLYCAVVLRAVHSSAAGDRVPYLAVTLGVLLALASLGALIYFIHHVATSIQADQIIAQVGADLDRTIERLFPKPDEKNARATDEEVEAMQLGEGAAEIVIQKTGYLRAVATQELVDAAKHADVVIQLKIRPREFVVRHTAVALVEPASKVDDTLRQRINEALIVGRLRTPEQDVEFCINQLVELALRALSPGINDPGTAMLCIDRLCGAICWLGTRDMPTRLRQDNDGTLRLVLEQPTFNGIADATFNQLRQHARGNVAVTIRLLEAIQLCVDHLSDSPERCRVLLRHAQLILNGAEESIPEESDRRDVKRRFDRIHRRVTPEPMNNPQA